VGSSSKVRAVSLPGPQPANVGAASPHDEKSMPDIPLVRSIESEKGEAKEKATLSEMERGGRGEISYNHGSGRSIRKPVGNPTQTVEGFVEGPEPPHHTQTHMCLRWNEHWRSIVEANPEAYVDGKLGQILGPGCLFDRNPKGQIKNQKRARSWHVPWEGELLERAISGVIHDLDNGFTEEIGDAHSEGATSRLIAVPRKLADGSADPNRARVTLDCKWSGVNTIFDSEAVAFKVDSYEQLEQSIRLAPSGAVLVKIDVASAFKHVMLHPAMRKWLKYRFYKIGPPSEAGRAVDRIVRNANGQPIYTTYQYTTLPFGPSPAPGCYNVVAAAAADAMRTGVLGTTPVPGVAFITDDYYTVTTDPKGAIHAMTTVLSKLGFTVHPEKTEWGPTLVIRGVEWNMSRKTAHIPSLKREGLHDHLTKAVQEGGETLSKICHRLIWYACGVQNARLFLGNLLTAGREARVGPLTAHIAKYEVEFWLDALKHDRPRSLCPPMWIERRADRIVYTDACPQGGGWWIPTTREWGGYVWRGTTLEPPARPSMPLLELAAILVYLHTNASKDMCIELYTDSATTRDALRRGFSNKQRMNALMQHFWGVVMLLNLQIRVYFVPGSENPADPPSRFEQFRLPRHENHASQAHVTDICRRLTSPIYTTFTCGELSAWGVPRVQIPL